MVAESDSTQLFQIFIKSDSDSFKLADGPIYLSYDTTIIPAELVGSGLVTFVKEDNQSIINTQIGGQWLYNHIHLRDQDYSRFGLVWELNPLLKNDAAMIHNNFALLCELRILSSTVDSSNFSFFQPNIDQELYSYTIGDDSMKALQLDGVFSDCMLTSVKDPLQTSLLPIQIYPNPAINYVEVKYDERPETVPQLYNIQGRVVADLLLQYQGPNIWRLELPTLTNGLYFLRWDTMESTSHIPLMIIQN